MITPLICLGVNTIISYLSVLIGTKKIDVLLIDVPLFAIFLNYQKNLTVLVNKHRSEAYTYSNRSVSTSQVLYPMSLDDSIQSARSFWVKAGLYPAKTDSRQTE